MEKFAAKAIACAGVVLSVVSTVSGTGMTTVYENDFSVRRSSEPVASANWIVSHYATDNVKLANNYTKDADTINMSDVNPWQDGWFKMHRGRTYYRTNLGLWYVRDDAGNAYASYSTSVSSDGHTLHAHPIYNAITCGVIRTTFDIRIPKKVHENWSRLSFTLGTKNMMVESTSKADMVTTGIGVMQKSLFETGFGVNNYGAPGPGGTPIVPEAEKVKVMGVGWDYGRDPVTGDGDEKTGPWPDGGSWTRVVVEADLDANTYNAWLLSFDSTDHPTLDTPSPSAGTARLGRKFYTAYNPSVDGPITGIIFHNVRGGTGNYYLMDGYDDDYAFKMDNVKMEWKAPGANAFEEFYLNDFNQCKRRTLTPAGTTERSYAVTAGERTDTLAYDASYVMPYGDFDATKMAKHLVGGDVSGLNSVGYDGWRRLDGGSVMYITTCGVHRVLAIVAGKRSWLVQQFGETPTSGKVKFEYDMRAPSKIYNGGDPALQGFIFGCLGSKDDWTCSNNPTQYFRSGMQCGGTGDAQNDVYPNFVYKDWKNEYAIKDENKLTSKNWYRIALTFDLDANPKTCAMTCTEIGQSPIGIDETPAVGARVWDGGNREFLSAYKDLSLIVLGTYAAGSTKIDESMLVTNLKITKNVGTTEQKVIYRNDFTTRTRVMDGVTTTRLASTAHDRMFEGLDTWQRNNRHTIDAYVTAGANPALMSIHSDSLGYFAQSIGGHFKCGTYVIRVDFRMPDFWYDKDGWCDVLFGNDMLKTGTNELGSPNGMYNHPENILFGMHLYPNSAVGEDGLCKLTRFSVICGDSYYPGIDLTAGNWCRCVCTLRLSGGGNQSKKVDVAFYDMGARHPELDDATPERALAAKADLSLQPITRAGDDAYHLSTVGIRLRNTANHAFWRNDESGSPIIDNIKIEKVNTGLMIIFR